MTSPESKSTFVENMERRNGSAKNAQRFMQSNRIGKLILRHAALGSIGVIVEPFSPGKRLIIFLFFYFLFVYFYSFLLVLISISYSVIHHSGL